MSAVAEIFSQGEELIAGHIADTNAAWLSQQLLQLGLKVSRHTAVGDDLDALAALFTEISGRADCCICTGGLGPTRDDLTSEALSRASGRELLFDPEAYRNIEDYFQSRGRAMPEINRKQALLPQGAERIDNPTGTAPGYSLRLGRCLFICLPGVPAEMQAMFQTQAQARLQREFNLSPDRFITLRCVGLGESAMEQRLQTLHLPPRVQLGFRAAPDEVQAKLRLPRDFPEAGKTELVAQIAALLGDAVYAVDEPPERPGGSLLDAVGDELHRRRASLSLSESLSHGLLAQQCWGRNWLRRADIHGPELAPGDPAAILRAEAENFIRAHPADYALLQRYRLTPETPAPLAGLVLYNALLTGGGFKYAEHRLLGRLPHLQQQAAALTLDLLRRHLRPTVCH